MRILPSALRNYPYTIDGDIITVTVDNAPLPIELGAEQVRRIALLALPYIPVSFDHSGVSDDAFRQFLTQFDLYYRKGGG